MWQIFLWTHCSWTLQNAPRDEGKLRELLKVKQIQKEEEATHMLKILKKVSYREIEMLKLAYFRYLKKGKKIELYPKDLYVTK